MMRIPLNVENVRHGSQINFVEEKAEWNTATVEEEFRTNSEVHKMIKGCDLVAKGLRVYREHKISEYKQDVRTINFQRNNLEPVMDAFIEENQKSYAVDLEGIQIHQSLESNLNGGNENLHVGDIHREEKYHAPKLGYYPFGLSFWTEEECSKLASSFTSVRDEVRYQGCDRSGMYARRRNPTATIGRSNTCIERMTRYHPLPNPVYRRRGPVIRQLVFEDDEEEEEWPIVWREQFDSIRRDFESAFEGMDLVHRIEWMNAFGKYWIRGGEWCRDDVEMMHWLMTGVNHVTVDMCGEHVGSSAVSNLKYVGN